MEGKIKMTESNVSKIQISRNNEKETSDKASTGAFSRWLQTDDKRLRIVVYPVGYEADHVCYDGHSFYVVEGCIKIELEEGISEWQQGDAFIIPDNVQHRIFNPFNSDARVVVVDNG